MWLSVSYYVTLGLYFGCENSLKEGYIKDIREYSSFLSSFLQQTFPISIASISYDEKECLASIKAHHLPEYLLSGNEEFGTIKVNKKPDLTWTMARMGTPYDSDDDLRSKFCECVIEFTNKYLFCKISGYIEDFKTDEKQYTAKYCEEYRKFVDSNVHRIIFEQCNLARIYQKK